MENKININEEEKNEIIIRYNIKDIIKLILRKTIDTLKNVQKNLSKITNGTIKAFKNFSNK